jgi:hypothetical protein
MRATLEIVSHFLKAVHALPAFDAGQRAAMCAMIEALEDKNSMPLSKLVRIKSSNTEINKDVEGLCGTLDRFTIYLTPLLQASTAKSLNTFTKWMGSVSYPGAGALKLLIDGCESNTAQVEFVSFDRKIEEFSMRLQQIGNDLHKFDAALAELKTPFRAGKGFSQSEVVQIGTKYLGRPLSASMSKAEVCKNVRNRVIEVNRNAAREEAVRNYTGSVSNGH